MDGLFVSSAALPAVLRLSNSLEGMAGTVWLG
jgi:hypothetical protein